MWVATGGGRRPPIQDLDAAQVKQLCGSTEGWVAGLVLAGLSLRRSDDPGAVVDSFGGDDRLVVEYLTEELLDSLTEHNREVLVSTSVVDRLCGSLVDHLTGRDHGARWLAWLAAVNQHAAAPGHRHRHLAPQPNAVAGHL
jgi:ATP/maltotriose-dependent transcriptional regulator MalT